MSSVRPTKQLPGELVGKVLAGFTLAELARVIRVNSVWHNEVVRLPKYWRHPLLNHSDPSAIDFFLARLRHSQGRAINVTIDFENIQVAHADAINIAQRVFLPVGRMMKTIERLCIRLTVDQCVVLPELIEKSPAPLLRRLMVAVVRGSDAGTLTMEQLPKLNINWLHNDAPCLQMLTLINGNHLQLQLPLSKILTTCSALTRLTLYDRVSLDMDASLATIRNLLANLPILDLGYNTIEENWIHIAQSVLKNLRCLTVRLVDEHGLQHFVDMLEGAVMATIHADTDESDISGGYLKVKFGMIGMPKIFNRDQPHQQSRSMSKLIPHTINALRSAVMDFNSWTNIEYRPRRIFEKVRVRDKLQTLCIPLDHYNLLVGNMRKPFPVLTRLIFYLGPEGFDDFELNDLPKIRAPNLRIVAFCPQKIVYRQDGPLVLDATKIVRFTRQALGRECPSLKQIQIELLYAIVDEQDSSVITDAFEVLRFPEHSRDTAS
ncbi:hypothetical protein BKA62DRAFT_818460 [Auriculariales sp. MPI-PUGE-AT-0066]|nr:hypothetical protein BKA62DRAFT_818460 [Auriculariales sp. MPI-PUGE-AT-0066]